MTFDWQSVIALALVASAAAYILRRVWIVIARRQQARCASGCATCPADSQIPSSSVVGIEALQQSAKQIARSS